MSEDKSQRAIVATCVANSIEWYDFAVYGAMAPVLAVVLFPPGSGTTDLVAVFALFATSFLVRPLGALLVGLRADRLGRRRALGTMLLLMSGTTAAIGLLLPWATVGVVAPLALLFLRLVQGFSSGGQISASLPFLLESAPTSEWGRYGGWHTGTIAMGIAAGMAVPGTVSFCLSPAALQAWGWRLPFLIALPLATVGLYVRQRLEESVSFAAGETRTRPSLRGVWRGYGRAVRTGFVLVAVLTGTFNMWFVYLPSHLVTEDVQPLPVALSCAAGGLLGTAIAAPLLGSLSDRVGRRPLMLTCTLMLGVLVVPLYFMAVNGSWVWLLVVDVLVGVTLGAMVISAHLAECFPVPVRATGIALTFGVPTALIGGTAPLVGSLLDATGRSIGIPIYLAALSTAGLVAALRAHPTRSVDTSRTSLVSAAHQARGTRNG